MDYEKNIWKNEWPQTRRRLIRWWEGEGAVLSLTAPRNEARIDIPEPEAPREPKQWWTDPKYRLQKAEYELANTYFGAESFPYFDTQIGPGNLASFIGCKPNFDQNTVWFEKISKSPSEMDKISFNPENRWFQNQMEIIDRGLEASKGRFLVGMPDLVENLDILASMRGTEPLLIDLIERPEFVKTRIKEINEVYFKVFDKIYEKIKDSHQGNAFAAFQIWGPGRTAKVQCDAAAMISPDMLAEFVIPALREQCRWLDYSMFHLDGTQCLQHLDLLLEIEELNAVEWTPQAGLPGGGSPKWYDLYHKILEAGKAVQAIGVAPEEVIPLFKEMGTEGMFVITRADSEKEARDLAAEVEKLR